MPVFDAPPIQPALPPVDERAAAGFARLSLQDAYWWETHRIDVDRLNMISATDDILGQNFGSFDLGLRILEITDYEAWALGYDIPPGPTDDEDHVALGAAWVRLIVARRNAAQAVRAVA